MTAAGPAPRPYLQVHPSRRCNLRCRHCYTSSGPDQRDALPPEVLVGAIRDAAGLGYAEVAVSGGEPLLFPQLDDLLRAGRSAGMATSFSTNAFPLTPRRAEALKGVVDLVAVSVDGMPSSHDRMRGHPRAFAIMQARLRHLREAGIPFAFTTTLTLHNAGELPWLMEFAVEQGARGLQVHPLDGQGRAVEGLLDARPDALELGAALLAGATLAPCGLPVHVDAVLREQVAAFPERLGASGVVGAERIATWLPSLVIEPDGTVVPLTYGMDRRFALGSLLDAPLVELARQWRKATAPEFVAAVRKAWEEILDDGPEVVFWFEALLTALRERHAAAA